MTELFFVRHAQPNYANHDDLTRELSPKGEQDCALVSEFFRMRRLDAVLSSPFRRAVDTVRSMAAEKGLDIVFVDDFRERRVDDVWIDDFNAFSRMQWADFDYKLPGGECLREVQARSIRAVDWTLDRFSGKSVAIGSHGTAMSVIINHYAPGFGFAGFEGMRKLMPYIVRFEFSGHTCRKIEGFELFAGKRSVIFEP